MSRVGRKPIPVPSGVTVNFAEDGQVAVKGPKGELGCKIEPQLQVDQAEGQIKIERPSNASYLRQQHGLARTLIANAVDGVTNGFVKQLTLVGVGYRATMEGNNLLFNLGYSHSITVQPRAGITFEVEPGDRQKPLVIKVAGIDKQQVGQVAADIRKLRPPDSYKGKGVRYLGEEVKTKPGKRGVAGK